MRRAVCPILLFLVLYGFGFTLNNGSLKGRVLDNEGKPLANVKVYIADSDISTETKRDGTFVLEGLGRGDLSMIFSHPDYVSQVVNVSIMKRSGQVIEVTLASKNPILMTIKEEITVTAEADSIIDVSLPSHRTILPSSMLTEMGSANIAESVEKIPGVATVGKGGYSMVPSIRGLAEHRVLLLVDGIRINSERRIGASASFVSLGDIDRIEVNRGPYSVFHGSGAVGGIINIITKSPSPRSPLTGDFYLSYNTVRNERAGSAMMRGSFGKWGWMLGANGKKADDYSAPSGTVAWSRYADYDFMFKVNRESGNSQLYATLFHYKGIDIGKPSPSAHLKPRWYPSETNTLFTLGYKRQNIWVLDNLNASVYVLGSVLETQKDDLREEDLSVKKRNLAKVEGVNFGFKVRSGKTLGNIHTLNFGLDFFARGNINDQNTEWIYDEFGAVTQKTEETSLQDARRRNFGFYVDDKIQLSNSLTFNVGGRFDAISTSNIDLDGRRTSRSDDFFTLYIGSVVQINSNLSLLGNIGRSFRFPTVSELFYTGLTGRGIVFGNPDLRPEQSLNFDIGFRYLHERFYASLYGFNNSVSKMIQKYGDTEDEEYFYRNLTSGRIYGVEGEFYITLAKDLELFVNFHRLVGKDRDTDVPLNYIPPTRLTFWGKYSPGNFWVEPRMTFSASVEDPGPLEVPVDGYVLLDTICGFKISQNLTLLAVIQNLLNRTYRASADESGVDAPGRGVVFRAKFSF
ncbi:MAG: TonB-dependent receptor [Candidatus Aminicenantes bacterium]|jgi:outer membrane receptor protein involved in Fe transport